MTFPLIQALICEIDERQRVELRSEYVYQERCSGDEREEHTIPEGRQIGDEDLSDELDSGVANLLNESGGLVTKKGIYIPGTRSRRLRRP